MTGVFKFKPGDKIRLKISGKDDESNYVIYDEEGNHKNLVKGDVVTVSCRNDVPDYLTGESIRAYGFVEDDNDNINPNWAYVEDNFELDTINWKRRLK